MAKILNISGAEITDRGIQKLADYIEANLPDNFTLVIGCKPSVYDVDAVLIGKGNIYAIECKDWKGNITGSTYGWWQKDGQVIENPLQQARNNAAALGKWLRGKIRSKLWVRGLVLFTYNDSSINIDIEPDSNSGVNFLKMENLKSWIIDQDSYADSKVIDLANNFFEQFASINRENNSTVYLILSSILAVISVISVLILTRDPDLSIFIMLVTIAALTTIASIFSMIRYVIGKPTLFFRKNDLLFKYDDHSDLVMDPLNIYDTYDKP